MVQNIFLISVVILILQFVCGALTASAHSWPISNLTENAFTRWNGNSAIFWALAVEAYRGSPSSCHLFVIPEDVAMAFTTYLGFAPRIFQGNDHRVGFGFRFGNHADLQILYEFGPQTSTIPLQSIRVRSARRRDVRRPFIELLLRAGILRQTSFHHDVDEDDEPR